MKYILYIILPIISMTVHAQTERYYALTTSSSITLNSISELTSYNGAAPQIMITDSIRGGIFYKYSGTDAADNGIIFSDALSRKWKRQLGSAGMVSAAWYGLSTSAAINTSTNYNSFMACYNYVVTHRMSSDITIPQGTYNFNQTITIDTSISIRGVGNFYDWKTVLVFPENTTAFRLKTKEGSLLNTVVDISDIEVRGNANYNNPGTLTLDSAKHAFDISCIVHFSEVNVNGYAGNGFNIDACATPGASNFGNSDNSYLIYCGASLCNNGIYINGCDANIITIHNSNFTLNRRFGIRDNGFLGNNYQKNHSAYNGVYKTFCTVLYNGVYYVAINPDSLININKQPDINPTYWQVITFTPFTVNTWNNSTKYYQGGSTFIENVNNYSLILGGYTEGGQPPIRNKGRSLSIGGDNGSGISEGAYIYANGGWVYIQNAGLVTENLNTTGTVTHSGLTGIPVLNSSGTMSAITGAASQVLRRNAANTGYEFATISSSGVTQQILDDSTAALRTTIATKQDVLGNNSVTNSMLAGSIATSKISNYTGYSINVQALTSSPADGATVYFGTLPKAPVTAAGNSKIYIRKACTLKIAEIYCFSGTAGTNESWSLYVRVNNTTDNLIATVSASASERIFSNTGLNISLNAGDYIEIKGVQPTWATNPLTTIYGGYLYFE